MAFASLTDSLRTSLGRRHYLARSFRYHSGNGSDGMKTRLPPPLTPMFPPGHLSPSTQSFTEAILFYYEDEATRVEVEEKKDTTHLPDLFTTV